MCIPNINPFLHLLQLLWVDKTAIKLTEQYLCLCSLLKMQSAHSLTIQSKDVNMLKVLHDCYVVFFLPT